MEFVSLFNCSSLTDAEKSALAEVSSGLPSSQSELLSLLVAKAVKGKGAPLSAESVASGSDLTIPDEATYAVVTVFTNDILYRVDGVAPTAANGHYASVEDNVPLTAQELAGFKFIAATGSSSVFVTYYK